MTLEDSSSPNRKVQVKGAVPPVYEAVKVTGSSTKGVEFEAVKLVITSGGMEKVKVTEWNALTNRDPETRRSTVSPCTIVTFLIKPKWPGGGLMKTMVFCPCMTKLVMSKGPKLTQVFL